MPNDTRARGAGPAVIRALGGVVPACGDGCRVDETAVVIGRVVLGAHVSVWPTAVIRGDTDVIAVGDRSNVQDGAVLHADAGVPCRVGAGVTVGHRAIVHGCMVEDCCLVGMGAILMNHVHVGAGSIVAAGAVLSEGTRIPPGSLVVGVPGRVRRATTADERESIARSAEHYVAMISRHAG